ncbi:hypothetical protein RAS2_09820 [Phycisphaerae bacterium RAS2]|nr:hypothetical protein RAS2_09820 [Phycisphaerae bacterium RAS2]
MALPFLSSCRAFRWGAMRRAGCNVAKLRALNRLRSSRPSHSLGRGRSHAFCADLADRLLIRWNGRRRHQQLDRRPACVHRSWNDHERDSLGDCRSRSFLDGVAPTSLGRLAASRQAVGFRGLGGQPLQALSVLRQHARGDGASDHRAVLYREWMPDRMGSLQQRDDLDLSCVLGDLAGYVAELLHAGRISSWHIGKDGARWRTDIHT